jgi:hypothetical protein
MSNEIPDHLLGTEQHRGARDLSEYLVHMTRTPHDLASINTSGRIEARNRFGLGRSLDMVAEKHLSACFTEMPLSELGRLRDRGKLWGIAFKREFVLNQGGQRVWYVDGNKTPHDALHALKEAAYESRDWKNSIWDVTPFVDERNPAKSYAFDWEREWRVIGGLTFELENVSLVIGLDEVAPLLEEDINIGAPFYNAREGTYEWADDSIPGVGANMEAILERFRSEFMTPDDAGLFTDPEADEDDGYWWAGCATRYETEDALHDLFPSAPSVVTEALANHLNQISVAWASRAGAASEREEDEEWDEEVPAQAEDETPLGSHLLRVPSLWG